MWCWCSSGFNFHATIWMWKCFSHLVLFCHFSTQKKVRQLSVSSFSQRLKLELFQLDNSRIISITIHLKIALGGKVLSCTHPPRAATSHLYIQGVVGAVQQGDFALHDFHFLQRRPGQATCGGSVGHLVLFLQILRTKQTCFVWYNQLLGFLHFKTGLRRSCWPQGGGTRSLW